MREITATPQLIKSDKAAKILGVGVRTLQRLVARGEVPVVEIPDSRSVRFRLSSLSEISAKWETFRSPFDDGPGRVAA